jgi:APA family basic amino acid/polyamine antiporter
MAMVAYTGIESITQLSAEAKNPGISIPKAIKWTAAVILVLHIGLSVISLSVLSPLELGTTYLEDPIAGVARNLPIGGAILAPWVGLIAAMILLAAANAGLLGCSRLMFSMGEHYQVPSFFHQLHKKFHTPHVALAFFAILAGCVIALSRGKMLFLTDLYNFGAQLAFFFVHLSLLALRIKKPDLARPYKAPWNIPIGKGRSLSLTAIIGLLATLTTWIVVIVTKVEGRILGFSWLAIGALIYLLYRKRQKMSFGGRTVIEKVKIPAYHPMKLKHILVAARSLSHTEALQTAFQLAKIHGAEVTVMSVLEIPNALPMDAPLPEWEKISEEVLKRAEAIGREYHISPHQEIIRSRSLETAILKSSEKEHIDLIILSADYDELQKRNKIASQTSDLLKHSKCPILFCRT